ncbi:MAG: phosphodiester glycosidase family protein [Solirubrobacteraceae bacterium]
MSSLPTPVPAPLAAPAHLRRLRVVLADGERTTVHVARYALDATDVRVVRLRRPQPLAAWCARNGAPEALVGGFYARPYGTPLGELRTRGVERRHVAFDAPWDGVRACVHVAGGEVTIARRDAIAAQPRGDLLQAGPLLVCDAAAVPGDDEGFSSGARQFDSDITQGRYPRAALGITADHLLAVACDGRADDEAGLSLDELTEVLLALGARDALNLDGGGSSSLICGGELRNVSREKHGAECPGGRAISTALLFGPR